MISKGVFLLVFVFLLMMYILVATTNSVFILQHKASLQVHQDPVEVQKKGASEWNRVRHNLYVTAGDRIRTEAGGQAELQWIDRTQVRLEPGTTLRVQRAVRNRFNQSATSVFQLDQGKVLVRVARLLGPKDHLEVRTPTATVTAHGTVFSVSVHHDAVTRTEETEVEVFHGQVEVRGGQDRKGHQLDAQQQIVVGSNIFHPDPTSLGSADLNDWQQQEILKPYLQVPPAAMPQRTRQSKLALTGETEPRATVTVNQQPVKVDPHGTFAFEVDLQPGVNEIEILARDPAGYTNSVKRTVVRLAATPEAMKGTAAGASAADPVAAPSLTPPQPLSSSPGPAGEREFIFVPDR